MSDVRDRAEVLEGKKMSAGWGGSGEGRQPEMEEE